MIRHFLTLTWNKKKRHLLVIIQLFAIYLLTCFLFVVLLVTGFLQRNPVNFTIDNLLVMRLMISSDEMLYPFKNDLKKIPEVKSVSLTDYLPYSSIEQPYIARYAHTTAGFLRWFADEDLAATAGFKLISGGWFSAKDKLNAIPPVVINASLQQQLFGRGNAVNKLISIQSETNDPPAKYTTGDGPKEGNSDIKKYKVIGVIADLNDPSPGTFISGHAFLLPPPDAYFSVLVQLKKPLNERTYAKLRTAFLARIAQKSENIVPVSQSRDKYEKKQFVPTLILGGVTCFLILNVILGLYSLLYQNINQRRPEIGLRRANGATSRQIYLQIISEVILLATLALVPGVIVAFQYALFDGFGLHSWTYYTYAMAAGVVTIYLLVMGCAIYPAMLAARIQPADALHED